MTDQKKIAGIVEAILEGTDKFLVEVIVKPGNRMTVYFDGDSEVTISDCQSLSRRLNERLVRDYEDFELNVSSPGLDKPLRFPRQYRKHLGRGFDVRMVSGEQITGILVNAGDETLELSHPVKNPKKEIQKPNTILEIHKIKSAKIIISFGK